MKNWLVGIVIAILVVFALILTTIFIKNTFSSDTAKSKKSISQKMVKRDINKSPNINIHPPQVRQLETTILEVKEAKNESINNIVTEIDDYINSKDIEDKEINSSKKIIISSSCKDNKLKKIVKKKVFHDALSRLAIIMDDIATFEQMESLKQIPYPVTPSIFPSTAKHPNTQGFAKVFKHYMVHVPMEAYNFSKPEENTLEATDSLNIIDKKISAIYKDFPDLIAINNHTGSKFTSSFTAMDKLFCVLDKYNIKFIDSKTAPHTLGEKVAKLHNTLALKRDVFLDNKPDIDYILSQIKLSVRKAKKSGIAIAICHPKKETFEALKKAEYLFDGIKLVYIDELY